MNEEVIKAAILKAIYDFQDETGAELQWQLVCSRFVTGNSANKELSKFITSRITTIKEQQ